RCVAGPGVVALIAGGAIHRVAARARPRLAGVGLRAGVAVVARRAVGLRRVGGDTGGWGAGSGVVALIAGGASHWVSARARPRLAGVGLRAGVPVVACRAVGLRRVRAGARRRIARPRVVALIAGGASHRVPARAGPCLAGVGLRAGVAVIARRPIGLRR